MYIFNAAKIKEWDQFTIQQQHISSIDLMERAAQACTKWISDKRWNDKLFTVFCGQGNNGGDGLAIARQLLRLRYKVHVVILENGKNGSADFQENLKRLHDITTSISYIQSEEQLESIPKSDIIIDALFGSGLNKMVSGIAASLISFINKQDSLVISIDIPSGLFIEQSSIDNVVIHASFTLTFQTYKLAFLIQENAVFTGNIIVLDIGLSPTFLNANESDLNLLDSTLVKEIFKPRKPFAHKGNYGHALLITGSFGKMGAAVLCTEACLHAGIGLLTSFVPGCGYYIMQTSVPEAMVITDENENYLSQLPEDLEKYTVLGVGPGIGTHPDTQKLISFIVRRANKPIVIDADALNCISQDKSLLPHLPANSVLTPHPKEFDRLFGEHKNDFERLETSRKKSRELNTIIVLKGHHTAICTPGGLVYFNSTGNAGMAKGGSGDALTGIITALIGQKYEPVQACILGVYLHGLAGDIAASELSMEFITASDLIRHLGEAFMQLSPQPLKGRN